MTETNVEINPEMTMQDIMAAVPAAQRALFQRYHVGGCSSCGYEPTDSLAKVCKDHNLLDINGVVQTIILAHETDQKMQVSPATVKEWFDAGELGRFLDVRTPDELALAKIDGAEALDYNNSDAYMQLPKDTKMVFFCHTGERSLDVASYFIGHGFKQAYSMRGGISAWSDDVDSSVPKYEAPQPAE